MRFFNLICVFLIGITILSSHNASAEILYIKAETAYTSSHKGVIKDAVLMIKNGKIHKIGDDISIPKDANVVEAKVITPGLIDSHTVVGINGAFNVDADQDAFEKVDNMGAEYRVLDSFNPHETLLNHALTFGVTTVHVTPQPAAPVGGISALFKTHGATADSMALKTQSSVMFNLGEAPKAYFGTNTGPSTRMATAAVIREALYKAKAWMEKDEDERKFDLSMEALSKVLSGELLAIFTAHREHDIVTATRIAKEFNLTPIINYGTEGYLIRDSLKKANATVINAPTMQRTFGEKENATLESAMLLNEKDIPFVFSSGYEGYVPKTRVLLWEIAIAVANGLDKEKAIEAATITPAKLWGIDENVGSLEKGKDADIVLYEGDPFEYTTKVTAVYVNGKKVSSGG